MRHPVRVIALALVLAAMPACAALQQIGETRIENPASAARTVDQHAYALLLSYAATLEEAADLVRDPATPVEVRAALGRAERAATPVVEALAAALQAYRAGEGNQAQLRAAIEAADTPIAEIQSLVRANQ